MDTDRIVSELRTLIADANRYRFLKRADVDAINAGGIFAGMTPDNVVLNGLDLDEGIDAAMDKDFPDLSTTAQRLCCKQIVLRDLHSNHPVVKAAHAMVEAHSRYVTALPALEEVTARFPDLKAEHLILLWVGVNAKDLVTQQANGDGQ